MPLPSGAAPSSQSSEQEGKEEGYFRRWLRLSRAAHLYLLHAALLTLGLAMSSLVFNLAVVALDFPPVVVLNQSIPFLGVLGSLSVVVAAGLALPLLWLTTQIGYRRAMLLSAALQAGSAFVFALLPEALPLLFAVALTGVAGVLFQVSAAPFMMQHSDDATRDHLFSANTAVNIGFAGLGGLLSGTLAVWFAQWFDVSAGDPLAYRATFGVAGAALLLALVPLLLVDERRPSQPSDPAQPAQPDPSQATPAPAPSETSAPGGKRALIPAAWLALLHHPWPVLRLLISPLLISLGASILIPYLNLFFQRVYALPDDAIGSIIAAISITTGLAALAGPLISVRIGKIRTIVLTQLLSLPFLLMLGFVPLLGVAVGAALARAALFNMGSPLYDAFAMERTDEPLRPVVIGLINGAFAAGYIIGAPISTAVQRDYGFAPLFAATAVCYTLAALANYWLFVRRS